MQNRSIHRRLYEPCFTMYGPVPKHLLRLRLNTVFQKAAAALSKWVKKYSSDFSAMEDLQPITNNTGQVSRSAKSSGENELQKKLEEARRKIICLETMIDIAEREIGVDIRKKSGTKQ